MKQVGREERERRSDGEGRERREGGGKKLRKGQSRRVGGDLECRVARTVGMDKSCKRFGNAPLKSAL